MDSGRPDGAIARIREFNRFFTRRIGVLRTPWVEGFSLTEARVIYETGHREMTVASDLAADLELDPGYLSRVVSKLAGLGLIERTADPGDARRRILTLTPAGSETVATLDRYSDEEAAHMLAQVGAAERPRLVRAMTDIERLLGEPPGAPEAGDEAPRIRTHEPGDMGWIVYRHAALYHAEQGWGAPFEALVARVAADFLDEFDPALDRCLIAETETGFAGCVFIVHGDAPGVAKLRLLIVEPAARGAGVGTRLVAEAVSFARRAGYARIELWTQGVLTAARRIYERVGFVRTAVETHTLCGPPLEGETWELEL